MSGFHEHTDGREFEVECNRCGYTRLLFLLDGVELRRAVRRTPIPRKPTRRSAAARLST